jgi:serine/threonine protein kinase
MEYFTNNLASFISNQVHQLTWESTIDIAINIAHGLVYLHKHRLLHGNLHPHNILLNDVHSVKLSDYFGYLPPTEGGNPKFLLWSAPEDILSTASDVYQLGLLLTFLGSGEDPLKPLASQPWKASLQIEEIRRGELQHRFRSSCPVWYQKLALACLVSNPIERPSATYVMAQLQKNRSRGLLLLNIGKCILDPNYHRRFCHGS